MKLFQIEEPDGSPGDPDAPGAAIGIDASAATAQVAVAVGGNPALVSDRAGFAVDTTVPDSDAPASAWQGFFERVRLRAERALARPVSHAVLALGAAAEPAQIERLNSAAAAAGLTLLEILAPEALGGAETPASAAAIVAEDLAPRSGPA
ncbi:MAG: hypothetical protein JO267_04190 [Alphaproteobacteria bacterium]|nr:hypothetical protein [Alphaproteobacteria bacterium]